MACWSCVRYPLTFYSLGESFVFEKGVETFPGVGANPMVIMPAGLRFDINPAGPHADNFAMTAFRPGQSAKWGRARANQRIVKRLLLSVAVLGRKREAEKE